MDINVPLYIPEESNAQLDEARSNAGRGDRNFLNKLVDGYKWQVYALNAIQAHGYWGAVHPLRIRPDVSKRDAFSDEFDILVGSKPSKTGYGDDRWVKEVDVKARTRTFTDPGSFPFDTIIIEPTARFSKRDTKPDYWCMVSQFNGSLIFINYDTAMHWQQEFKNSIKYTTAPRECFLTLGQFLDELPN